MYRNGMKETDLLHVLGDQRTLTIFQAVRAEKDNVWQGMTRKEFYTRMARLKHIGLVRKNNGYHLTALGKLVATKILDVTINIAANYWSLKAIENMTDIPDSELHKMVALLIKDEGLQKVLI